MARTHTAWSVPLALFITVLGLLGALYTGTFIGYPLVIGWLLVALALWGKDYPLRRLCIMSWHGISSTMLVLQIFLFIGAITALWQASGTLPTIVIYSLESIVPSLFLLSCFILPSAVSYLIGSSLGTAGTIGLPLILLARLGHVPLDIAAGAIIAGAYVGDRASPMSSSAALVATLTKTTVPDNVGPMFRTALPALILSCIFYGLFSWRYPLETTDTALATYIASTFVISPWLLLPAVTIIFLVLCKVKVRMAMLISAVIAFILAYTVQHQPLSQLLYQTMMGFHLPDPSHPLYTIFKGGGIITMIPPAIVITAACALSTLLEESDQLEQLQSLYHHCQHCSSLFVAQCLTALATAGIGANQSVAIVMNYFLTRTAYNTLSLAESAADTSDTSHEQPNTDSTHHSSNQQLMMDLENSAIVIAPLLPWNIAALVPTVMLGVSMTGYLPYAAYLYLLPLCYWLQLRLKSKAHV